ncbi:aminotransferase class V-fold PLP-dependent enzyme [Aliidiomarina sp.]|uniref:aminotransferase class V-fold PLP-dependent enzyme n=1 Tax=Aliidiomarina sp. TaxID=1872439 RepID=UPI003A4DB8E5
MQINEVDVKAFCVPEVFLDANATTPVLPDVAAVMQQVSMENFGNPSSPHMAGLTPKSILANTRSLASKLLNGSEGRFIFNSGATEGINNAVLSALIPHAGKQLSDQVLLYGATEHKAIPEALKHWNTVLGVNAQMVAVPVDESGALSLAFIQEHMDRALILCTMGANNETGVVHNLAKIAAIREQFVARANRFVPWLVDGVQILGKVSVDLSTLKIDYATFSAHKLYGPKGVGCLYVRNSAPFTPMQVGGGQEYGERGGTENVAGIAAFGVIFNWLLDNCNSPLHDMVQLAHYREQILAALRELFPALVLNQPYPESLPTTVNFSVPGYSSGELISMFDAAGIRVSAGSACSAGRPKSFVLDAMGLPTWQAEGAIRLSFGPATDSQYIEQAVQRIRGMAARLAASQAPMLSGLVVPAPTQSGLAVIADKPTQTLYLLGKFYADSKHADSGFDNWLSKHFPTASWQQQTLGLGTHEVGDYQVDIREQGHFSVLHLITGRHLEFNRTGVILANNVYHNVVTASAAESIAMGAQFIDVREHLESSMQEIPALHGETLIVPRAKWCEFALTVGYPAAPESSQPLVTVCRSGGRSVTVAGLTTAAGGPKLISCAQGATDIATSLSTPSS